MSYVQGSLGADASKGAVDPFVQTILKPLLSGAGWTFIREVVYAGNANARIAHWRRDRTNGPVYLTLMWDATTSATALHMVISETLLTANPSGSETDPYVTKAAVIYNSGQHNLDSGGWDAVYAPSPTGSPVASLKPAVPRLDFPGPTSGVYEFWASATADDFLACIRIGAAVSVIYAGPVTPFTVASVTNQNLHVLGSTNLGFQACDLQRPGVTAAGKGDLYLIRGDLGARTAAAKDRLSQRWLVQDAVLGNTDGTTLRGVAPGLRVTGANSTLNTGDTITVGSKQYLAMTPPGAAPGVILRDTSL